MSDTSPGAIAKINGSDYRLYNASLLPRSPLISGSALPGTIVAHANDAICI